MFPWVALFRHWRRQLRGFALLVDRQKTALARQGSLEAFCQILNFCGKQSVGQNHGNISHDFSSLGIQSPSENGNGT